MAYFEVVTRIHLQLFRKTMKILGHFVPCCVSNRTPSEWEWNAFPLCHV